MQRRLKTPKALKPKRLAAEGKAVLKTANNSVDLSSKFDSQGSYTGVCTDNVFEMPVQDADDL